MSSIKDLIKKRGGLKAKLTSFGNFLNLIKGHEILVDRQKCELERRLSRINTTFDQFDALQIETLSEQVDDEYNERIQYEEQYYSLVHKFHYLRAALKSSASLIIQSLDITANNYPIAWQLLTDRYDNTRLLIYNHLQALFKTNHITSESSSEIRNLIDVLNKNLRALGALGEPVDLGHNYYLHDVEKIRFCYKSKMGGIQKLLKL
ncbi:unnamed protein product [Euphydryas editha]|uniref:Uncharacterized protein n=1 Tax=Euphydryas editha TaxID=104508 RepID=A0AAU9TE55_EUPED|nr:unnamed protein product [Euphydryas editha]